QTPCVHVLACHSRCYLNRQTTCCGDAIQPRNVLGVVPSAVPVCDAKIQASCRTVEMRSAALVMMTTL
ncbi:MAG: hypothetical protein ACT6R6_18700, partial [Flavobacterium sp.]|uniref:hypothetical protein n=1 Tax=Flavobacterium sp. TaxID=239 RepID=UPI0040342B2A